MANRNRARRPRQNRRDLDDDQPASSSPVSVNRSHKIHNDRTSILSRIENVGPNDTTLTIPDDEPGQRIGRPIFDRLMPTSHPRSNLKPIEEPPAKKRKTLDSTAEYFASFKDKQMIAPSEVPIRSAKPSAPSQPSRPMVPIAVEAVTPRVADHLEQRTEDILGEMNSELDQVHEKMRSQADNQARKNDHIIQTIARINKSSAEPIYKEAPLHSSGLSPTTSEVIRQFDANLRVRYGEYTQFKDDNKTIWAQWVKANDVIDSIAAEMVGKDKSSGDRESDQPVSQPWEDEFRSLVAQARAELKEMEKSADRDVQRVMNEVMGAFMLAD